MPGCNFLAFAEGSWTYLTEKESREYSNAFWNSVTISFSKCVDVRRDFYAFLFSASNFLTNRRSCFPLNWARYQIWTKATGEISVMALIFGYISRYAVLLPRCGNYPGFVEGSWTFSREKEFQEYSNAFWDSVTISFSKCVDVRRDFYAFLFQAVIL